MQFVIYDKSTKVPRGERPRLFGNGRASFERAWTRRSTTVLALSTLPPLSNSPPSTQIMCYYTIYILWAFCSSYWWPDWWDMVMGRVLVGF